MAYFYEHFLEIPELPTVGMRPRPNLILYIPQEGGFRQNVFIDNPELLEMQGMGVEEEGTTTKEKEIGSGEPSVKAALKAEETEEEAAEEARSSPPMDKTISSEINADFLKDSKEMFAVAKIMTALKNSRTTSELKSASISKTPAAAPAALANSSSRPSKKQSSGSSSGYRPSSKKSKLAFKLNIVD